MFNEVLKNKDIERRMCKKVINDVERNEGKGGKRN